jgi:hypothetical protein
VGGCVCGGAGRWRPLAIGKGGWRGGKVVVGGLTQSGRVRSVSWDTGMPSSVVSSATAAPPRTSVDVAGRLLEYLTLVAGGLTGGTGGGGGGGAGGGNGVEERPLAPSLRPSSAVMKKLFRSMRLLLNLLYDRACRLERDALILSVPEA